MPVHHLFPGTKPCAVRTRRSSPFTPTLDGSSALVLTHSRA